MVQSSAKLQTQHQSNKPDNLAYRTVWRGSTTMPISHMHQNEKSHRAGKGHMATDYVVLHSSWGIADLTNATSFQNLHRRVNTVNGTNTWKKKIRGYICTWVSAHTGMRSCTEQAKLDGKYQWKFLLGNIRTSSDQWLNLFSLWQRN